MRTLRRVFVATVIVLFACASSFAASGPQLHLPDADLAPAPEAELLPRGESCPTRQLWAISSRHARANNSHEPRLAYWRWDSAARRWNVATGEDFQAAESDGQVTCFYVHGNRVDHPQALCEGQRAYQQMVSCLPSDQPLRFVIWSWPSSQIEGPLKDVRHKACVSDSHAWHLAWLLDHLHPHEPVSLIGYSYGARLVSGALHLLGGGNLAGRRLAQRSPTQRLPLRAVLLAGALDSHALLPHGRNNRAISQVEQMLILVNPRDAVLHHYPLLAGLFHKGPPALGYTGFYAGSLGAEHGKVAQWNVSGYVGKEHDWQRYFYSPAVVARMRAYALFADGQER